MASGFGGPWFNPNGKEPESVEGHKQEFPDMKEKMNVTYGKRSGVIILTTK